eukprot:SAG11_NODE_19431_length_466_cov_3.397820_1_plen_78_part_10
MGNRYVVPGESITNTKNRVVAIRVFTGHRFKVHGYDLERLSSNVDRVRFRVLAQYLCKMRYRPVLPAGPNSCILEIDW